jgi:hypothetical protein
MALLSPGELLNMLRLVLVYAMVLATLASGLQYLWRAAVILYAARP